MPLIGHRTNFRHLGFDLGRTPKEIVCRIGATRVMLLKFPPTGKLYKYQSDNETVVTIREVEKPDPAPDPGFLVIELEGKGAGVATVTIASKTLDEDNNNLPGTNVDRVKVFVYPEIEKQVNFIRVLPHASQVGRYKATAIQSSHVPELIRLMNALYKYQANIVLRAHRIATATLTADLDLATAGQPAENHQRVFDWMLRWRDANDPSLAHFNVFLVSKWAARDATPTGGHYTHKDVYGTTFGNCCVCEDMPNLPFESLVIGHELAHAMNAVHDEDKDSLSLMAKKLTEYNLHIYPVTVRQIRGMP